MMLRSRPPPPLVANVNRVSFANIAKRMQIITFFVGETTKAITDQGFSAHKILATVKAHSGDLFLRIRFYVPKTESRRSDGPISRFHFCGENVGRSFVVCSHDPFFRTNRESLIWRQNDHAEFVGAFYLSMRVSGEN